MAKLFILLGVCLAYAMTVTAVEECSKSAIETFFKCEEEEVTKGMKEKETFEKDGKKCFFENHCKPCDEEEEEEHHKGGSGHHHSGHHSGHHGSGEFGSAEREEMKKFMECKEETFKAEHKILSDCVKGITGLPLPEHHNPRHHEHRKGGHRGEHHGSGHGSGHEHGSGMTKAQWEAIETEKLEKACENNATNVGKVETCLKNLMHKGMEEMGKFCKATEACFKPFAADHCTKKNITETIHKFKAAVKTCMKEDGGLEKLVALAGGETKCKELNTNLTRLFEHHHHEHHHGSGSGDSGEHENHHMHHSGEHHSGSGHHHGEEEHNPIEEMCKKMMEHEGSGSGHEGSGHNHH